MEKLSEHARARLRAGLDAGDPDGEVAAAWWCAQTLHDVYRADTPEHGREQAAHVLTAMVSCPVTTTRAR